MLGNVHWALIAWSVCTKLMACLFDWLQEIDGKALLLLNSDMMMKYMGLKLGPALKICNLVTKIKCRRQYCTWAALYPLVKAVQKVTDIFLYFVKMFFFYIWAVNSILFRNAIDTCDLSILRISGLFLTAHVVNISVQFPDFHCYFSCICNYSPFVFPIDNRNKGDRPWTSISMKPTITIYCYYYTIANLTCVKLPLFRYYLWFACICKIIITFINFSICLQYLILNGFTPLFYYLTTFPMFW